MAKCKNRSTATSYKSIAKPMQHGRVGPASRATTWRSKEVIQCNAAGQHRTLVRTTLAVDSRGYSSFALAELPREDGRLLGGEIRGSGEASVSEWEPSSTASCHWSAKDLPKKLCILMQQAKPKQIRLGSGLSLGDCTSGWLRTLNQGPRPACPSRGQTYSLLCPML